LDIKLKNHTDPFAFSIFVCANQPDTFTLAVELTQQHLINTYTDFYRNLQQEINGEQVLTLLGSTSTYFVQPFFTKRTREGLNAFSQLIK